MTELTLYMLLALGNGPCHGYAIGKEIEARSQGRLDPSTGALYQSLKRLTDAGLVKPSPPPAGESLDVRRKHFEITKRGRQALAAEMARLDELVALARRRRLYRGVSR